MVRGLQMKSRMQPYTWAQSELLAIVRQWAGRPVSATSEFALLTDGISAPLGAQLPMRSRLLATETWNRLRHSWRSA